MSNAIPMALRPAARAAHQWSSLTSAFARRYCATQPSCFTPAASSPVLSALRSRTSPRPLRSFSTAPRIAAKVDSPGLTHQDIIPPQQGLPQRKRTIQIGHLPSGRVSDAQIRSIFGARVAGHDGNSVLRILHHRRTSGSLADYGVDNLGDKYNVSRDQAVKALDWLRNKFPIDEARAAEAWAEKEANRIAYELWLADPENDSKYKDPARVYRDQQKKEAEEREQEAEQQEKSQYGILRTGKSQFEVAIKEKRRQRLEEITRKAEEKEARAEHEEKMLATGEWVRTPGGTQLMKPGQDTYVDVFGREQISRRKEMMEKAQKEAQTSFKDEAEMLSQTTLVSSLQPPLPPNQSNGPRPNASTP
jgi:rhomboid-like protein